MKANSHTKIASCLAVALAASVSTPAHAEGFAVARHRTNTANLDAETLRKAYSGRIKQWESGAVVQVALIVSEDAPETKYLAGAMGMSPREFLNRVQQEVFRGEMRRPTAIRSSADCVAAVRANPGTICPIADAAVATLPAEVTTGAKK